MAKVRTSLYLDEDNLKELLDRRIIKNISETVNELLDRLLVADMEEVIVQGKLTYLDETIAHTKVLAAEAKAEHERLVDRLESLEQQKVSIKSDWEAAQNTVILVKHVRRLNEIIVVSKYDEAAVQVAAKEVVSLITKLNPAFDLHEHITRLKRIRTS